MILILEDNPDKLSLLLMRFRDRIAGKIILCADSVTKGQLLVQKFLAAEEYELWLDEELVGSHGHLFLDWAIEFDEKPKFVVITSQSRIGRMAIHHACIAGNIPSLAWAGPFS